MAWVALILFVSKAACDVQAAEPPPDVPASVRLQAAHQIFFGEYAIYQGSYVVAGDYIVEIDSYDEVSSRAAASFTVRRAADHVAVYSLSQGSSFDGTADPVAFSDGVILALRLRDTPDGPARISVHSLATGAKLFVLSSPNPRADDDFGSKVWFTDDRVLVAAPGRDYRKPNAGVIFIFDRATGRLVGTVSPGIKNAYFGSEPPSNNGDFFRGTDIDFQPHGVPYVQTSGKGALIVHGSRIFRLYNDRLQPLVLPPLGNHHVTLKAALLAGNRIVLTTSEQTHKGYSTAGRVIVFDMAKGKMLYRLGAAAVKGSSEFPSGIAVWNNRLFVHDADAGFLGTTQRGALHVHDLVTGKRLTGLSFPAVDGSYQDSSSLTLSGGLLWLRTFGQVAVWQAYDPATLTETLHLTPPGDDVFRGRAPQPLGGGRFGVTATRVESRSPFTILPTVRSMSSVSIISIGGWPWSYTSAGILIYDPATSSWTHRLVLEGEADDSYVSDAFPSQYDNLRIALGAAQGTFRVSLADKPAHEILDFDTVLPSPTPSVTLEGHLHYTPQPGYAYDLLRQGVGETEFTRVRTVGLGDGVLHDEIVPYADYQEAIPYRLDGTQFSRHLSAPEGEPVALGAQSPTALVGDGTRIAVRLPGYPSGGAPGTVRVLDAATGATVFTLSPSGNGTGPIAITDAYIAVGAPNGEYAGGIDVFDAVTGVRLRTLSGGKAFGASLVLSGNLLAATWVDSTYAGGTYTHTSKLAVFDLPSGSLLRTISLVSTTSAYSWNLPPANVVGAGGRVAVRTMAPGGSFADAGRIRVIDLATGSTVYELSSPAPETGDYFGNWLAASGNRLAVGSSGTSEVFIYDFDTGGLSHTLVLADRSDGIENEWAYFPRLSIDADSDLLSWFVTDDPEARTAAYIFDLGTGLEEAKVLPPKAAPSTIQTNLGGAVLSGDRLIAVTTWEKTLVSYPLGDALAVPLLATSENLTLLPVVRLEFSTRRGVGYQAESSSDGGASWNAIGSKYYGDGQPASLRLLLTDDPSPDTLSFRLHTDWGTAP